MTTETVQSKFADLIRNTPGCRPAKMEEFIEGSLTYLVSSDRYIYGTPKIVSLPKAKQIFIADEQFNDFVYIRPWSVVFFDVTGYTSHEIFLAGLWAFFDACKTGEGWHRDMYDMCYRDRVGKRSRGSIEDNAANFLSDHYGFYMSSAYCSDNIKASKSLVKTAQEKTVFKDFNFRGVVD